MPPQSVFDQLPGRVGDTAPTPQKLRRFGRSGAAHTHVWDAERFDDLWFEASSAPPNLGHSPPPKDALPEERAPSPPASVPLFVRRRPPVAQDDGLENDAETTADMRKSPPPGPLLPAARSARAARAAADVKRCSGAKPTADAGSGSYDSTMTMFEAEIAAANVAELPATSAHE